MKTTAASNTEIFTIDMTNDAANDTTADERIRDEFDDLVMRASQGDRRAIGAIAVAIGPKLLVEVRTMLGEFDQEAEDVLQDFLLALLERRLRFDPAHGRAMPWMCRMVRAFAWRRSEERERDWGLEIEEET
jgi:DNA-directed RNA polymerase specialized sigma24 family protein